MKTYICTKACLALLTFACILFFNTGCITRSVQVTIKDIPPNAKAAHIDSVSVWMPPKVYHSANSWVPLHSEKYAKILADSILQSFHVSGLNTRAGNSMPLDLYVIVRGCGEVIGAYGMKIAACTAWCLVDSAGNIIADDQFYAYSSGALLYTQQNVRNRLSKTIVTRIGRSCLQAIHNGNAKALSPPVPYTYNQIEALVRQLPSMGVLPNGVWTADWHVLARNNPVNWQEHVFSTEAPPSSIAPSMNPPESVDVAPPLQSESKSEKAWKRAEAGDAAAQYELGIMYASGKEIKKDEAEAVNCFLAAAEQGYVKAQYALGVCYTRGRGVAQNSAEGVKWLKRASENGYEPANTLLQKMGYGKP